jgi:hypothetical protein
MDHATPSLACPVLQVERICHDTVTGLDP